MRHSVIAAVAATAIVSLCQPAQAQGFLKRLADRALDKVEQKAEEVVGSAMEGSSGSTFEPQAEAPETQAPDVMPDLGSKSDPVSSNSKPVKYVSDLRTPPEVDAQKAEYNKFGEASCRACEGGVELDGRPTFPYDEFSGKYNERAERAGNWPIGHIHRWQGKESVGTLAVKAEERVEGFRCRKLEYKLVKGQAAAVRPGLICYGLGNSSSEAEKWHEIY
jgi:hypothetical protein